MTSPELISYVKTSLAAGKPKEQIYKELLSENWSLTDIEEAFTAANSGAVPKPNIPKAPIHDKEPNTSSTHATSPTENVSVSDSHQTTIEDAQSHTTRVILNIGVVLVAVGIFSFIAANWQYMDRVMKVGIVVVLMLASYAAGWYLREKRPQMSKVLFILGTIIYGAGIFLVAQIFNIRANWPDGFILWMLGTMAMAYALEFNALYYIAAVLGLVSVISHPFTILLSFSSDPFLLTSTTLLAITTFVTFMAAWYFRKKVAPELKDLY